jgi:hypothetical protein
METSRYWNAWLACLVLLSADAWGQVFSHKHQGEHFEATVTADRVLVKERYKGATTVHGDLSCPLGSAVRASLLPSEEAKLCLMFSAGECEYSRYQNGAPIHKEELANARVPMMCIALGNERDANRLVALVNAGPHSNGDTAHAAAPQVAAVPAAAGEPVPAEAARRVSTKAQTAQAATAAAGSTHSDEERTQSYSSRENGSAPRADGKHAARDHPVSLFIHVRNAAQRAKAERLVKPLASQGIRVTGIRVIGTGPSETDLRYFYTADARDTPQLVRALRKLGVPAVEVKHIAGLERRATPRQYELWLAPPEDAPAVRPPPRSRHKRSNLTRG